MTVVAAPARHGVAVADRVALLGNPNTGKTTIFNSLCGARAKTSNFPGTTTTVRLGHYRTGDLEINAMDLPGVYELNLAAPEAEIAREVLGGVRGAAPGAIVVVIDACNLTRNLVLVGELLAYPQPVVPSTQRSWEGGWASPSYRPWRAAARDSMIFARRLPRR
jgi:Fe2+ transport system protein B